MEKQRRKTIVNDKNRAYYSETRKETKRQNPQNKAQRHRAAKKASRKVKIKLAFALAAGILIGSGGTKLLNPGVEGVTQNKKEIVVDLDETDKDLKIEGNKRQEFIQSLVDQTINNELELNTKQEVNNLQNPEEVLEYIKEIYVSEYNKSNKEPITIDDVSFSKNKADIVIYSDKAENGDDILRYCSEYDAKEMGIGIDGDKSILSAHVKNGETSKTEKVAQNYKGEYQAIYSKNQEVKQNDETLLENLAEVIFTGIDMSTSMEQKDNNSWQVNREYEQRFIDALKEYKNKQIEEIINGDTNAQQVQRDDGFEPGE